MSSFSVDHDHIFALFILSGFTRTRSGNWTEVPKSCEQGCYIRVGSEAKRGWEEGKCLVFDDSFEHEADLLKELCGPFFGIANIACTFRFYKFCLVSKIVDSISIVHPLPKKGMIQHDKADSFLQKGSHTQKPGLVQHRHHADSLPLS